MQIPKVQKIQSSCLSFFALSGTAHPKAARRTLIKFTASDLFLDRRYQKEWGSEA